MYATFRVRHLTNRPASGRLRVSMQNRAERWLDSPLAVGLSPLVVSLSNHVRARGPILRQAQDERGWVQDERGRWAQDERGGRLLVVRIGATRLIDNVTLAA